MPCLPSLRGVSSQGHCKTTCQTTPLPRRMPPTPRLTSCASARRQSWGRALSFDYVSSLSGQHTHRMVLPKGVDHSNSSWYLDAFDLSRGGARTFRLDHMTKPAARTGRHARSRQARPRGGLPQAGVVRPSRPSPWMPSTGTRPASRRCRPATCLPTAPTLVATGFPAGLLPAKCCATSDATLCEAIRQYASRLLV